MFSITRYMRNILVATDQLLNSFAGGLPDETISSRLGRRSSDCKLCGMICRMLDKIDPRHCVKAVQSERDGEYLPPELRE